MHGRAVHPKDLDATAMAQTVADLDRIVAGEVRFGHHDRMLYSTDASIYQVEPLGVVVPRTIEDVVATVQYAAEHKLPILPRGGGTSLAGQAVNRAIVIDCSAHLRHVIRIDPEQRIAVVQPGVVLDELNHHAGVHGLMFGPDVATSTHANIGGMIGNNSAGAHSVLYGRTVEHLRSLDVVLADGSRHALDAASSRSDERIRVVADGVADTVRSVADDIDARFPRTLRRVNGYNLDLMLQSLRSADSAAGGEALNLAHLVCGSEGTLAVTLEAELELVPVPATRGLALIAFDSVEAALGAVPGLLETSTAAVELIDDVVISVAQRNLRHRTHVDLLPRVGGALPAAVLYVEYFADSERDRDQRLKRLARQFQNQNVHVHVDPRDMQRAWALRKAGEPLLHALPGSRKPISFIEDLAVDPARLNELVSGFREITARHGTRAAYYAHASVGCLHIRPLIDLHDAADRERMVAIAREATELVQSLGGALSGEHGDGRARSHLLEQFYGTRIVKAFSRVKELFDPEHRLNPGNIVDPPPMTHHLRVIPGESLVQVPSVETYYRYDREHGFSEAVWQCNGAGVCRRTTGGTMCPSYRALLDERHSTRGRANALRLAITGQVGQQSAHANWDDPDTLETLDLCLSCKACKAECPSNVDVSKLKAEYLAQTYRQRGRAPLASRLLARLRQAGAMASLAPGVVNALLSIEPARSLIMRSLAMHPARSLPRFNRSLFSWMKKRTSDAPPDAPVVVLYPDCHSVYFEPHIGRAAVRVLEGFGYRVVLPRLGCCGRVQMSLGLLEAAQGACTSAARSLSDELTKRDVAAIVGLEPSCISALTDDWPDLKIDAPKEMVRQIAVNATLLETFLADRWDDHPRRPTRFALPISRAGLLHGHCHQKALWGCESTLQLLNRIDNFDVQIIDSGCCGMAGSFGYGRDRFDLSMQIAEQSLAPAVQAAEDAIIMAPGTSCRQQILDATKREALHPIEVVANAMIDSLGR